MAENVPTGQKLKPGEHWGAVINRRRTEAAVFSESVYGCSMDLPEHSHELAFFTLIVEGYYSEILGRREIAYLPKTVLWRQAEFSHKDKIEAASSRFFFIEIDPQMAQRLGEIETVPSYHAEQNGALTSLAYRLRSEIIARDASSTLMIDGITLEMLGILGRQGHLVEKRPPKWLGRVIDRLNDEFAGQITTESLASDAGVHPVHLAAIFRRFHNETIGDYIQKRRVEHAMALLMNQRLSLIDIAGECGFADQSHFTRIFKRRIGVTPGVYRDSIH